MDFHWSLSDSKSPQVSMTFFCILADLNNAVVWMLSIRPSMTNSSSPLSKPLRTSTRVNYMWYHPYPLVPQLSLSSSKVKVLVSPFAFFHFHFSVRTANSSFFFFLFFLLFIFWYSWLSLVKIMWSVRMSKAQRILRSSFPWMDSCLWIDH